MWTPITISILSGFVIELFFRTIRYHSKTPSQRLLPKYKVYITVSEYISADRKKEGKYLLFRTIPPIIILVFTMSLYSRYFQISNPVFLLLTSSFISLLPRDIVSILKKDKLLTEKIFHISNILNLTAITIVLSISYKYLNYAYIAPSWEGLIDNLWSSLLVALILVAYLETTKQNVTVDRKDEKIIQRNYIINSYNKISSKFGNQIEIYTAKNKVYKPLLYAILTYENMNRPEWLRNIEKLMVKRLKISMTVGIAQVNSKKPLTDIESIKIATDILKNSKGIFSDKTPHNETKKREIINLYNKDVRYYPSIMNVMTTLENSFPELIN